MIKFLGLPVSSISILAAVLLTLNAQAQQTPEVPDISPAAKNQKPEPAPEKVEGVEVTGKRDAQSDRRNSTAAKIIINREDIEQYGDTNLGDVLKRLPGVTQAGRPGRGGGVSMRGMGGGYTQMLINGERSPPGFSVEQISPDQVERIEILRAPTAETGTRAVAGTINIVLREPLKLKSDEFKIGVQEERNRYSPNASWNRNDSFSDTGTYNLSLSLNRNDQLTDNRSSSVFTDLTTGLPTLPQQNTISSSDAQRDAAYLSSRVQWRLGQGELFSVQPFLVFHKNRSRSLGTLEQSPNLDAPYATSESLSDTTFNVLRLNTQLLKRLDAQTRLDVRLNGGGFQSKSDTTLNQFAANNIVNLNEQKNADISDRSWSLNLKAMRNFEGGHSGVLGTEVERVKRTETGTTKQNNAAIDVGGDLKASINRTALFIQDEWDPAENLSANLGVRWESIQTDSDDAANSISNESRVITPVGHLVWRFASPRKDQVRLSLTQSYKPPTTQNLIARASPNNRAPLDKINEASSPDSLANPNLKAELAKGVDLAYERYLTGGGIVSVNLFRRNISDLIRNVVSAAPETVSYATAPRYVSRPQNVGSAVTQGVEFDAKFKLSDAIDNAPPVNLRLNLSVYDSKVSDVIGPYNRIDQQPRASGNFGLDYKLPATSWSIGGNIGITPAYTTQVDDNQSTYVNAKRVTDVYAIWAVTPKAKLRFGLANFAPLDSESVNRVIETQINQLDTTTSIGRSDVSASVRLEMRL